MRKPIDFHALDLAIRRLVDEHPSRSMKRTRAFLYVTTSAASGVG